MARPCGFNDIRKDAAGYFCCKCHQRMDAQFENLVRFTLPPKFWAQLQSQIQAG